MIMFQSIKKGFPLYKIYGKFFFYQLHGYQMLLFSLSSVEIGSYLCRSRNCEYKYYSSPSQKLSKDIIFLLLDFDLLKALLSVFVF